MLKKIKEAFTKKIGIDIKKHKKRYYFLEDRNY